MEWLNKWTKNWKLKHSFALYLVITIPFSFYIGYAMQAFFDNLRIAYLSRIDFLHRDGNFLTRLFLSKGYRIFLDFLVPLILILFFLLAFFFFYRHKIEPVLQVLRDPERQADLNEDELGQGIQSILEKQDRLEKENLACVLTMNNVARNTDTLLHELKNPLATMKGDIELLELLHEKNTTIEDILGRLKRNEERLENYLYRLTEKKNLNHLEIQWEEISAEDLFLHFKKRYTDYRIPVHFTMMLTDSEARVKIDPVFFWESVENIMTNAATFAKSSIDLCLSDSPTEIVIQIHDDGPGFSKDALNHYNKPYYSENSYIGNMGLGLFLTDTLLKKQDIDMKVSNEQGAKVEIILSNLQS